MFWQNIDTSKKMRKSIILKPTNKLFSATTKFDGKEPITMAEVSWRHCWWNDKTNIEKHLNQCDVIFSQKQILIFQCGFVCGCDTLFVWFLRVKVCASHAYIDFKALISRNWINIKANHLLLSVFLSLICCKLLTLDPNETKKKKRTHTVSIRDCVDAKRMFFFFLFPRNPG